MKKIIILTAILLANQAFAQWALSTINKYENFNHVQFLTDKVGYTDGYGKILKTQDGGASWDTIYSDKNTTIVDVFFINENMGFFSSEKGGNTFLNKTKDGGKSWKSYPASTAGKIYFTNELTQHLASGDNHGGVFKSKDGGLTTGGMVQKFRGHAIGNFFFVNENVGYLAGWSPGYILKTINGGKTWSDLEVPQGEFLDIYFPSLQVGYTSGLFGKITKTTDEGKTWTELNTGLSDQITLYSITCTDNNTCYAVGDAGTVIKTSDGGSNWELQPTGTTEKLNSISIKNNVCYIVGDAGVFLKGTVK